MASPEPREDYIRIRDKGGVRQAGIINDVVFKSQVNMGLIGVVYEGPEANLPSASANAIAYLTDKHYPVFSDGASWAPLTYADLQQINCAACPSTGGAGGGGGTTPTPRTPPTAWPHGQTFSYSGAFQVFTIPASATWLKADLAGGGSARVGGDAAVGGYAGGILDLMASNSPISPGDTVVVGVGGFGSWVDRLGGGAWPFAAHGHGNQEGVSGGGGMSVLAIGSNALNVNDQARAVLVAGGAGGHVNFTSGSSAPANGANGGAPNSGGNTGTFAGAAGPRLTSLYGGSGSGYEGGFPHQRRRSASNPRESGEAGSNFAHPGLYSSNLSYHPEFGFGTPSGAVGTPVASAFGGPERPGLVSLQWD